MAIIKCKMCGGDLELIPDSTVCECEYCGTRQTVPAADDEKKLKLFERANRLRRACEFDKAAGVYESIVADFDTEAEAYWGLVLCKFGIEYVDDPATGKKVPTCHRSSFESIFEDENFEQACENADAIARRVYREEAKAIEELRKGIIEVSSKEEPYDIFISYKELTDDGDRTLDSVIAQDIYTELTNKGYRVFFSRISLEDKLGTEYEPYIFAALQSAKVMLVVGTDYDHFNAVWVKNEWSRFLALIAAGQKKTLIPVFKDIDAYDMPKEFNKLAAQDMGKVGAMQDLLRGVEKILPLKKAEPAAATQVVMSGGPNVTALQKRGMMALEDGQWDKAKDFFDQVLNMDAENAEAWLGLALADLQVKNESGLSNLAGGQSAVANNANYQKFLRFASAERRQQIQKMVAAAEDKKKKRMAEEAERRAAEEKRRAQEAEKRALERIQAMKRREEEARKEAEARKQREAEESAAREAFNKKRSAIIERIAPAQNRIIWDGGTIIGIKLDGSVLAAGNLMKMNNRKMYEITGWKNIQQVSFGSDHTVGLKADGTVVAVGKDELHYSERRSALDEAKSWTESDGRLNVSGWKNIVQVAAGSNFTIGLKADGTVCAAGANGRVDTSYGNAIYTSFKEDGRCDVGSWRGIAQVYAEYDYTIGLKKDGTLAVAGDKDKDAMGKTRDRFKRVSDFRGIKKVCPGAGYVFGLKKDGKVCCIAKWGLSRKDLGRLVARWDHIVDIVYAGRVIGLREDGTVEAAGDNEHGECDVYNWKEIVAIDAGLEHTVGLKADGTVVAVGNNEHGECNVSGWTDVVAIAADYQKTAALKADGTVLITGDVGSAKNKVANWRIFNHIDTIDAERKAIAEKAEAERRAAAERAKAKRRASLKEEQAALNEELKNLKGLFTGKRRREIEARLAEISDEIKSLAAD